MGSTGRVGECWLTYLLIVYGATQMVEPPELGAQNVASIEISVAVHTVQDLVWASRMQVVLHHEVQKLPETFADLIHELRERDLASDQPLAGLGKLKLPQPAVGVPYYEPRDDLLDAQLLLRQYGPFLAPKDELFPTSPLFISSGNP
jgi:hypothetical protein